MLERRDESEDEVVRLSTSGSIMGPTTLELVVPKGTVVPDGHVAVEDADGEVFSAWVLSIVAEGENDRVTVLVGHE